MAFKIFENDGLVSTRIHGLKQEAYVMTEEKVESFNNSSSDFQLHNTLFPLFLGVFLTSIFSTLSNSSNNLIRAIFWCSLALSILEFIFLIKSYKRFNKVKNKLFVRITDFSNLLSILKAEYGTLNKKIDITEKLSKKINDNKIEIKIDNGIAGDPAIGEAKEAVITYSFNGEEKTITLKGNEMLKLP